MSRDDHGFDPTEWNEQDATRTLVHAQGLLDAWSAEAPSSVAPALDEQRAETRAAIEASNDLVDQVRHLWHGLISIAERRRLADDAVPTVEGTVVGLHRSDGGVPKTPVDHVDVGWRGVAGDRQATRVHHGRPWQALCLWSTEVIDGLAADGHPIARGSAGENVTVEGVDWSILRSGTVLDLGAVRCQLWSPADPCSKLAGWFSDGDVSRIHPTGHPERTRWYASVLRPGSITIGDTVTVSP